MVILSITDPDILIIPLSCHNKHSFIWNIVVNLLILRHKRERQNKPKEHACGIFNTSRLVT